HFTEVISEPYGRCYQFSDSFPIYNSGPGYGLELLLNIESYEYSGSMTDSLGLAFYISPSSEPHSYLDPTTMLPVYPGMYTTIALNRQKILRLKSPYDECGDYQTEHLPYLNKKVTIHH
ncbi:acid-sensing ion channel 2-like, partial [Convolutriloba macropyga]